MKHSVFLKTIAIALCAAALLGSVLSGAGLVMLTELDMNDRNVEDIFEEQRRDQAESLALILAENYASRIEGGCPEDLTRFNYYRGENTYGYTLKDENGIERESKPLPENAGVSYSYTIQPTGRYRVLVYTLTQNQWNTQKTASQNEAIASAQPGSLGLITEEVNLRIAPHTSSEVLGQFSAGETVEIKGVQEIDGKIWVRIPEGWIYGKYVTPFEDPYGSEATEESKAPEEAALSLQAGGLGLITENVNVRSTPHASSEVLGHCAAGDTVEIKSVQEINGEVWINTPSGWILGEYVTPFVDPARSEKAGETTLPLTPAEEKPAAPKTELEKRLEENPDKTPWVTLIQDAQLYASPDSTSAPRGTIPKGTSVAVFGADTVDGQKWALLTGGWTPLSNLELFASEPEETEPATAPTTAPTEETQPTVEETMAAYDPLRDDGLEWEGYYDEARQESMMAGYRYEVLPEYTVEVRLTAEATDEAIYRPILELVGRFQNDMVKILVASLLVLAVTVVYLCCAAGHAPGTRQVQAGGLNRIPLDLYFVIACGAGMALAAMLIYGTEYLLRESPEYAIPCGGILAYLLSLTVVGFCYGFVAQIKTPGGYWWRNSLCGRCILLVLHSGQWIKTNAKGLLDWCIALVRKLWTKLSDPVGQMVNRLPLMWQWLLVGGVIVILFLLSLAMGSLFLFWVSILAAAAAIVYAAYAFATLLGTTKQMRAGDLDAKVDDKRMAGAFKEFAGELNGLGDVVKVAAQKQVKSERMKTELITNVSHDIKTPLTSIINYVDLMEKPHSPEEETQYLEVLSRQSQSLKKLIDDLMEMSKANSGNLNVELTTVDLVEAVKQALGEYADKLEKARLQPVFRHHQEQTFIHADGRLVWRVLSNLLSNAVKYAMPGTRVYVDLVRKGSKVTLSVKNMSREELNISAEELMERFVRGDASRNTEGSGLGLNIARSLMEVQNGTMELTVDGDLFKVMLVFAAES